MQTVKYVYWEEEGAWLGYLQETLVPDWGSRDLAIDTIRSAIRQLGMDWAAFEGA
jgi:hypothetical protein